MKPTIASLQKELQKKKREIKHLEQMVDYDDLTGLYNRRGFIKEVNKFLSQIQNDMESKGERIERKMRIQDLSIIFLDINKFKKINDTLGHEAGDTLLRQFGKFLLEFVRDIDMVTRWSGDEFVLALVGTRKEEAHMKIRRLKERLKKRKFVVRKKSLLISLSAGVASVFGSNHPVGLFDIETLVDWADKEMYRDKRGLRGRG